MKQAFQEMFGEWGINLNEQQHEAVTTDSDATVVFAGPGSGKTTVLVARVAFLLTVQRVDPGHLMVVTFTRAAAQEMKDRIRALVGPERTRRLEIGTFHSVFLRILNRALGTIPRILTEWEQQQLIREVVKKVCPGESTDFAEEMLGKIGLCKNHLILPGRIRVKEKENVIFNEVFTEYENQKALVNVWDFDDILVETYSALLRQDSILKECRDRFRYILIDEFQDTNLAQAEVIGLLGRGGSVYVVGDDDQAIYRFRGANVEYLLGFERRLQGTRKIYLTKNYRSTNQIIQAANALIQANRERETKVMTGTGVEGRRPVLITPDSQDAEAEQVVRLLASMESLTTTTAVLFRTNQQSRALVDAMVRQGIAFSVSEFGLNFYEHWVVRDVLAYLQLAVSESNIGAFIKIANRPFRSIPHILIRELQFRTASSFMEIFGYEPHVSERLRLALATLRQHLAVLRQLSPGRAVDYVRSAVGYDSFLDSLGENHSRDSQNFKDILKEMEDSASQFPTITAFLSHIVSVAKTLEKAKKKKSSLQLMTYHRSKGLEFDHVILVGCVEGIIPHRKATQIPPAKTRGGRHDRSFEELSSVSSLASLGNNGIAGRVARFLKGKETECGRIAVDLSGVEEERRLFYVALTRAKRHVTVSVPKTIRGVRMEPSRFLREAGINLEP